MCYNTSPWCTCCTPSKEARTSEKAAALTVLAWSIKRKVRTSSEFRVYSSQPGTHDTRRTRLTLTHAHFCVAAGAGSNRNHSGGLRSLRTALRQHKKVVIVVITEHGAKECWITWRFFGFFANDDVYNTSPGCNLLQIATCYRIGYN